jgi:hypothetical protein
MDVATVSDRVTEALAYLADLRAQGHREADLARALEQAGWTPVEARALLRAEAGGEGPGRPAVSGWVVGATALVLVALIVFVVVALLRPAWRYRPVAPALAPAARSLGIGPVRPALPGASNPESTCLANLKNLMMAQMAYAADHDGRFPPVGCWYGRIGGTARYPNVQASLLCPADNRPSPLVCSYAMSLDCDGATGARVGDPALGVLFDTSSLAGYGRWEVADYRHRSGLCVGFADGHAGWRSKQDFLNTRLAPLPGPGPTPAGTPTVALSGSSPAPPPATVTVPPPVPRGFRPDYCLPGNPPRATHYGRVLASLSVVPPVVPYRRPVTITAQGGCALQPDLAALVSSGRAHLDEDYDWFTMTDLRLNNPGTSAAKMSYQGRQLTYIFGDQYRSSYQSYQSGWRYDPAIWVAYTVTVTLPDGTVEWARAEARYLPRLDQSSGGAQP